MEERQSILVDLILDKKYRIMWHILFWVFIYVDPLLSIFGFTSPIDYPLVLVVGFLLDVFLVYFNMYVLIPKLLWKNKIILYILLTVLSIVIILVFNNLCLYPLEGMESPEGLLFEDLVLDFFNNAEMLILPIAIKFFKHNYEKDKRIKEISEERLKTELGFLKNQVNPHFLFNTMNSFYIQAKKNDKALPEAILSLSDLLRYQIYDTTKEYVPLKNEIDYIKNYLDLEKNRRDNLDIQLKVTGITPQVKIAPLLLLPLVENAVKYSQMTDGSRSIININVEVDDQITFAISNTKGKVDQIKSPDSGIGLDNLTKRLDLIYPDDHSFRFKDSEKIYTASINLGKR